MAVENYYFEVGFLLEVIQASKYIMYFIDEMR